MNNGLKAALLSGLIVPGLGQLVLGQYIRAAVYMSAELVILAILAYKLVRLGLLIIADVQKAQAVDLPAAAAIAATAVGQSLDPALVLLVGLALACWIISVADAFLTGNRREPAPGRPAIL